MERERALEILKTLADGIDPASGEQFSTDSPYQHPDTVRALFLAIRALENPGRTSKAVASRAEGLPENAGKPWSDEEDGRLGNAHDAGQPIDDLAREHKRSRVAIEARLVRLGKIEAPQYGSLRYPVTAKKSNPTRGVADAAWTRAQ